jgi:transposase-like protein
LPRPKKSCSAEYREEAVKLVIETSRPIAQVAKELGVQEGTLGSGSRDSGVIMSATSQS